MGVISSLAPDYPATKGSVAFEQARRMMLVRGSPFFAGVSSAECAQIVEAARPRSMLKGDIFFLQGQPFRKLILLESGCVKLTLLNTHGSEVILALRGAGEMIDLSLEPTSSRHSCTAQVVVPGRALTWSASDFEGMINRIPQLTGNMYLILQHHMRELENRYHEICTDPVARRLACTLIRLTRQLGVPEDSGIGIHLSRQELAQMCGMTLFTVSRLISKWAELGLLVPRREALLLLDRERLDSLTESGGTRVEPKSPHRRSFGAL